MELLWSAIVYWINSFSFRMHAIPASSNPEVLFLDSCFIFMLLSVILPFYVAVFSVIFFFVCQFVICSGILSHKRLFFTRAHSQNIHFRNSTIVLRWSEQKRHQQQLSATKTTTKKKSTQFPCSIRTNSLQHTKIAYNNNQWPNR